MAASFDGPAKGHTDSPLIFGRVLDGHGAARTIDWQQGQDWQPAGPGEVLWLHLDQDHEGLRGWLEERFALAEPTAELLVSSETRPRAFREGDALVATLRGINFNPGAQPEDMISLQLWCDGQRLVTLRRLPLQTPREIAHMLDKGDGPRDAGAAITLLAELLIGRMSQSIVDMNAMLDLVETQDASEEAEEMLTRISLIRRNCLALKRHMAPQHEALEQIARDAPQWFEDHDRREMAESIARLRRYLDDVDISKESALVLQDDLRARSLASSERATYTLTIVAGIFLPLSFLTGLLGINVGGIPGVDDPAAFWLVTAGCAVLLAVLVALFRRLDWL
jgi:zinc transporter